MAAKNLNSVAKLIIPLLDDNITHNDISYESGFVNAYTEDKNRPYLEDYIFLLYDSSFNTIESLNRFLKFRQLDTLYSTRYIKIDKKHYTVYTFTKANNRSAINNIIQGSTAPVNAKLEIYNFWKIVPSESYNYEIFLPQYRFGEFATATMAEEDYYPEKTKSLIT